MALYFAVGRAAPTPRMEAQIGTAVAGLQYGFCKVRSLQDSQRVQDVRGSGALATVLTFRFEAGKVG